MEILVIRNYKTVCDLDLNFKKAFGKGWKRIEYEAGQILMDEQRRKKAVVLLALTLIMLSQLDNAVYAAGPGGIDKLGAKFWSYVKVFAKWSCLVMCGIDVVKNLNVGDAKSISKVLFKYILAYATVVLLPWIFKEIDAAVQ